MARREQHERQDHAVDGDGHAADAAVLAGGDLRAALERPALRQATADFDHGEVGRDQQARDVERSEDEPGMDPEDRSRRDALGQDAHEAVAASILAWMSGAS